MVPYYPGCLLYCSSNSQVIFIDSPPCDYKRGMEFTSHDFRHHHFIVTLSSVTLKLQGFFDALAYSATPQVLKKWQNFLSDTLVPTIEWSYSPQSSSLIGGMVISSDSSRRTPPVVSPNRKNKNPISSNSNSNSKGSSYFSYAQEESECGGTF